MTNRLDTLGPHARARARRTPRRHRPAWFLQVQVQAQVQTGQQLVTFRDHTSRVRMVVSPLNRILFPFSFVNTSLSIPCLGFQVQGVITCGVHFKSCGATGHLQRERRTQRQQTMQHRSTPTSFAEPSMTVEEEIRRLLSGTSPLAASAEVEESLASSRSLAFAKGMRVAARQAASS
jgi:hypothetical protein